MEYTQEQVDEMLANATKGLFTEEDLKKEISKEVDRRVDSGIKKGIETQKAKLIEEIEARAKLSGEELAKKEFEELQRSLEEKSKSLAVKENLLDAKTQLASANVPSEYYEKLLNNMVTSDIDSTKTNIDNLISIYNNTKSQIEANIKAQLTKVPPADKGNGGKGDDWTKEKFNKASYNEKLALKESNPDVYHSFIK